MNNLNAVRISERELQYVCQRSWYDNNILVPVVVIKGKNHWIEWKKFIKIGEEWIGISLRYHRSNKQWKILCIEYDCGRIFYQHRLVGNRQNNNYCYSYNKLTKFVTTSLHIY
eukprot:UN12055